MNNALTPEQQRAMVAAYTIPLPEPAFGFLVVSEETGQWIESRAGEAAFDADNLHAHAAAVSAAKDAEIAGLREYLDAAQRRGEELRAQVAALTENGPPMQRGTTIEGTPLMGTMREVLEDYKSAADTEAKWGDEARAEVAGLRKALAAAIRQNEHDMLMTGEELRAARAALGDKTPTTPLPSPSPRS